MQQEYIDALQAHPRQALVQAFGQRCFDGTGRGRSQAAFCGDVDIIG